MEAIQTYYNGYKFRSRLEARWAYFFDLMRIEYEYEAEGLDLDGQYYLPDFYLPRFNLYFEVKRAGLTKEEKAEAVQKISYGIHNHPEFGGMICYGDPEDNDLTLYCIEYNDSSGGSAEFKVEFGRSDEDELVLRRIYDTRDRETYADLLGYKIIPTERYDYSYVPDYVKQCRLKARQAQFEHGMTPANPYAKADARIKEAQAKRLLDYE